MHENQRKTIYYDIGNWKKNESIFASFRQKRMISDTNKEKKDKQQIYDTESSLIENTHT